MSKQKKVYHAMSEYDNPRNKPKMAHGDYPSKAKIEEAGHEMKVNLPSQLAKTKKKFGKKAEKKQRIAMMLDKARKS